MATLLNIFRFMQQVGNAIGCISPKTQPIWVILIALRLKKIIKKLTLDKHLTNLLLPFHAKVDVPFKQHCYKVALINLLRPDACLHKHIKRP